MYNVYVSLHFHMNIKLCVQLNIFISRPPSRPPLVSHFVLILFLWRFLDVGIPSKVQIIFEISDSQFLLFSLKYYQIKCSFIGNWYRRMDCLYLNLEVTLL